MAKQLIPILSTEYNPLHNDITMSKCTKCSWTRYRTC